MRTADDILYALATELSKLPEDKSWFELTGPEKTEEVANEARFLAKHDPAGYTEREFYKRRAPEYMKDIHPQWVDQLVKQVEEDPKSFFKSDLWRKSTAPGALGQDGERLLVGLMKAAARNLIRKDPVAALVEFKLHHYQQFKEFVEPLYWALVESMGHPNGYNPDDLEMRKEFERLKKEQQQLEERKMSRSGDEMMLELAALMGTLSKTAAKKDEEKEEKAEKKDKKEEKSEKKEEKKEKAEKKEEKKEKKADVMMHVVSSLVKLAGELDQIGAEEASSLVDDALRIIVKNIESEKTKLAAHPFDSDEDITESFEELGDVSGREEGAGTRTERTLQTPEWDLPQSRQEHTPEGLGMKDFSHTGVMEDNIDRLLANPQIREYLKEKLQEL